jgi:hypothetical protein
MNFFDFGAACFPAFPERDEPAHNLQSNEVVYLQNALALP